MTSTSVTPRADTIAPVSPVEAHKHGRGRIRTIRVGVVRIGVVDLGVLDLLLLDLGVLILGIVRIRIIPAVSSTLAIRSPLPGKDTAALLVSGGLRSWGSLRWITEGAATLRRQSRPAQCRTQQAVIRITVHRGKP
jgi:hypothetical protein